MHLATRDINCELSATAIDFDKLVAGGTKVQGNRLRIISHIQLVGTTSQINLEEVFCIQFARRSRHICALQTAADDNKVIAVAPHLEALPI